jgi:outer membrane protein TolC
MKIHARLVPALAIALGALQARADTPPAPDAPADATAARSAALDARIGALFAAHAGLTSDEVAARAAATSFDVQARHAELEAANAAVDQAIVGYLPRVTLTGRYLRLNPLPDADLGNLVAASPQTPLGPLKAGTPLVNVPLTLPALPNNTILHANVTIPVSDYVLRLSQAHAAASRSAKAAELSERAARLKAALDGRLAYYGWARAKLQAFVAHQALEQSRDHLTDVKHLFEVGSNSKADVLRVEAQVANSELLVQRAEGFARTTEETVRIAMHEADAARAYALGEDLRTTPAPLGTPRDLAKLNAEALERRPEIRALDETVWSLKEQGRVARALAYPRLDALGQLSYDNPEPRVFPPTQDFRGGWAVGGQITWTLNDIGNGVTSGKQVDARRAQVEAQKSQLLDGLRNEVSEAEQAVEDAEVAIETGTRALSASEESYRVRRQLFQNGRAISVELSDAETELTRASLDLVNARVELRVARARLLHAIGRDAIDPVAAPAAR